MQRVRSLGAAIGALLLLLSAQASAQIAICVDPGHGGTDPGAQGCGLSEADINLTTGLALRDLLAADPALKPLMTRTTDVFVSLGARAAYANDNGAVRFASVHSNSATPAATGIETYSATSSSAASVDQRDRIQDAMVAAWPLADRGGKTAGFYVIVNTVMPATLSELGFITNCDEDAKWLGSSAERQKAAQAHLDALRASLGLEPGEGPGPTPTTGTLRGVVYEDQGVGSADLSVRLPGAQVTASCPGTAGGSAVAASPDGAWLFERPPGTCTVTASMAGYVSASRACAVLAGATTWCSVGLAPVPVVAEPVPDAGMPDVSTPDTSTTPDPGPDLSAPPDEGEPPDAGVPDVAPADAPADPGLETVGPPADSAGGDAAPDVAGPRPRVITFGDATVLPPRAGAAEEAGGGCQGAGGAPQVGWLLLALLLWAVVRRRRGHVALVAGLLAACGPGAADAPGTRAGALQVATGGRDDRPAPELRALEATQVVSLVELARVTEAGDASAPLWSPDGATLAFTRPGLDRLAVVPSRGGAARTLVEAPACGYAPLWQSSDALAWRVPGQRSSDVPMAAVDLEGRALAPPQNPTPGSWVLLQDDQVWLRDGRRLRRLSPEGDRYCCAARSPDGRRVVFLGLSSGLHVVDLQTGAGAALGPGRSPVFSSDGARVAFVRETDDGERVLTRSMHITELDAEPPRILGLDGAPPMADHPALSPDGRSVAFDAGGALWTARVAAWPAR
ncbi:MAG: N-acetylmuramoyl-L-alanine amidase [Deltaproteobacteria bacterium]|nr:N-acetylmuramoyl-L-alanine amidase [Deltaproteobacteria bacterium]